MNACTIFREVAYSEYMQRGTTSLSTEVIEEKPDYNTVFQSIMIFNRINNYHKTIKNGAVIF